MLEIIWHNGEVPKELKVRQVYGIIFDEKGRLLLKVENKKDKKVYSFAGGTPEDFDKDMEATLRRELIEEVNTTIKEPILVGYQEIIGDNGKNPYAQVRMTAMIDKIGIIKPDPDNGETYERVLVSPEKAIKLLNWGDVGEKQILEAVKIAKREFDLKTLNDKLELV